MSRWSTRPLRLYAEGPYALFCDLAFVVEKVTYDVMTPTAARGLVKSILWKPSVFVEIDSIAVCRPIRKHTITVNGVTSKSKIPSSKQLRGQASLESLVSIVGSPEQRLQARHVMLVDVAYVVTFRYLETGIASERGEETPTKFEDMWRSRIQSGAQHRLPCFGLQQHVAFCRDPDEVPSKTSPIDETRPIGMLPLVNLFPEGEPVRTVFHHTTIHAGVMHFPPQYEHVLESEGRR